MLFTIVSEFQGTKRRDTRMTPHEALLLASTLVQSGVDKVWVFDNSGAFVSATALQQMARDRADPAGPHAVVVTGTTDLLAREPEPERQYPGNSATFTDGSPAGPRDNSPKKGRVFRMATQQ